MPHHVLRPRQALNKAYLKQKIPRADMERFKTQLRLLLDRLDPQESEEHAKNHLRDFLQHTGFADFGLNTKGRTDLVIHLGPGGKSPAGVLIEVKRPANKADMPTPDNLNARATQELLLYYLRERLDHHNHDLKHLVVTSVHTWFVFDALEFDRVFFRKGTLRQDYLEWSQGRKAGATTDFFYREIAAPALAGLAEPLTFAHVSLLDYEKPLRDQDARNDTQLVALSKLLSPAHLLKLPFANDSNSLDKAFYAELLHLIGLTETKEGGKKLIGRQQPGQRHPGSLLENAIDQLETVDKIAYLDRPQQYGKTHEERVFNVALELCITWVNRILFLKLLEAQLLSYHRTPDLPASNRPGSVSPTAYAFLNTTKIQNFDDLNSLFFRVLARRPQERAMDVQALFQHVPYLNSSLFEATALEHRTLLISNLRDERTLPLLPGTVLKDSGGRKRTGALSTLAYLFGFLDAYDFSSEGAEEIQEENKRLINASVLGLIFEKINGYRDGSFFTPGFITMYMCRETIRRAVLQKFNAAKGWGCTTVAELYDRIEDRAEANRIVNSLRICDPAVGSGHFLVSALNELLALKSELRILQDRRGRRLKEYTVEVVNDELVVTDDEGQPFAYRPHHPESQRVQETLFHEKQTLIESCLFGVDINPNSVKICRLRLWIELLKHAYYGLNHDYADFRIDQIQDGEKQDREKSAESTNQRNPGSDTLQTLPNIDINIKVGNSLISRFALDADLRESLRKSKWNIGSYKLAVQSYQHARSKEEKREMETLINTIKGDFRTEIGKKDKRVLRLQKLSGELYNLTQQTSLFAESAKEKKLRQKRLAELEAETNKLSAEVEEIKNNKLYENAFEWRFEFPEVLSEEGDFVGFDAVIGNPPYIGGREWKLTKEEFKYFVDSYSVAEYQFDAFILFWELSSKLTNNLFCLITPNTWLNNQKNTLLRRYLLNFKILTIVDYSKIKVFEDATVLPIITLISKDANALDNEKTNIMLPFPKDFKKLLVFNTIDQKSWSEDPLSIINIDVKPADLIIRKKIEFGSKLLEDYALIKFGIKIYETGKGNPPQRAADAKNKIFESFEKIDETYRPFLEGKDVNSYRILWKNRWLKYGTNLAAPRDLLLFEGERILVRRIVGEKLIASWTEKDYVTSQLLQIVKPYEEKHSKSILAILSSKLIAYYFRKKYNRQDLTFPEIRIYELSSLPIKLPTNQTKINFLVQQILTSKQADPAADTAALEAEIDRLVYGLYGLTEEEIRLVEGKE